MEADKFHVRYKEICEELGHISAELTEERCMDKSAPKINLRMMAFEGLIQHTFNTMKALNEQIVTLHNEMYAAE